MSSKPGDHFSAPPPPPPAFSTEPEPEAKPVVWSFRIEPEKKEKMILAARAEGLPPSWFVAHLLNWAFSQYETIGKLHYLKYETKLLRTREPSSGDNGTAARRKAARQATA